MTKEKKDLGVPPNPHCTCVKLPTPGPQDKAPLKGHREDKMSGHDIFCLKLLADSSLGLECLPHLCGQRYATSSLLSSQSPLTHPLYLALMPRICPTNSLLQYSVPYSGYVASQLLSLDLFDLPS